MREILLIMSMLVLGIFSAKAFGLGIAPTNFPSTSTTIQTGL